MGRSARAEQSAADGLKATLPLGKAIGQVKVPSYALSYDDEAKTLRFKPVAAASTVGIRALGAAKSIGVGHGPDGSVNITLKEGDDTLAVEKGKWAKATLSSVVKKMKLGTDDLKRLEDHGFNLAALRDWFVVKTEDGKQHYFALRDLRVDEPGAGDEPAGTKAAIGPGFGLPGPKAPDLSRSLIAFSEHCTDVHIIGFQDGKPMITIKKPVVYLYPEKTNPVEVQVAVKGRFIAQYPETQNGTWKVVAAPDGMLFDPVSERRFGYLFWEAEAGKTLAIDESRAFYVTDTEVESFLERAVRRLGLNDREKTDFISYWIAPLKRNPVSRIQFLVGDECNAFAEMSIRPAPTSLLRISMLFERAPELRASTLQELPEGRRQGFTVVEWGGVNLDELRGPAT